MTYDPRQPIDYETITLNVREFGNIATMPPGVMMEAPEITRHVAGSPIMGIRAAVLGEDSGPEFTLVVVAERKIKPRWMPAWIWGHFRTEHKQFSASGTPIWLYPHSTIKVPDLGEPVRLVVPKAETFRWDA